MRLFPGDAIPGLSLSLQSLPAPWVLPSSFSRVHRDRLMSLLWRALEGFETGLRMIQLRWAERMLLEQRMLHLPASVLVWWRIDAVPPIEPLSMLRESGRFVPGPAAYDFDQEVDIPAHGWLGALKMEVLHRLVDVLFDERPVSESEPLAEVLGNAAGVFTSPVDLLDFGEALIEGVALRSGALEARAEAYARVLSSRFVPGEGGTADPIIRTLVAAASELGLSGESQDLLRQAGLVEADQTRSPLFDVLREPEVLRRTLLNLVKRHHLSTPLWELAPEWFARKDDINYEPQMHMPSTPSGLDVERRLRTHPESPLMHDAQQRLDQGDVEGAVRLVLKAHERGRRASIPREELKAHADSLMAIARRADEAASGSGEASAERMAVIYELAAEMYEQIAARDEMALALVLAGFERMRAYQASEAEARFQQASFLIKDKGDPRLLAICLRGLGESRSRNHDLQRGREAYDAALALYRQVGNRLGEANTLRALGKVLFFSGNSSWQEIIVESIERAQDISDAHGQWLGRVMESAKWLPGAESKAREVWTNALRYFEQVGLQYEARLTRALIRLAEGDDVENVGSILVEAIGQPARDLLKRVDSRDRDAILRTILLLMSTS